MEKLRKYAQNLPITFESWILSFAGIMLVRIFLEQFSSFLPERFPLIDLPTIIHYSVFFLAALIALMAILMFFAKTSLKEVSVICILGFCIIWLAPIIDLMTGGIGGHTMTYLFTSGKDLLFQFLTYFGAGTIPSGVTLGIKIEGIFIIIFCYLYVYRVTKNVGRAIGAATLFYAFLFFLGSSPSVIALFLAQHGGVSTSIVQSMISSHVVQNNIHPSFSATDIGLVNLAFNKVMLGVSTIIVIFATMLLFFIGARKKIIAAMKNSRPERVFYFFFLFAFGTALAHAWPTNWIDIQSYILAMIALFCAAVFSICQNDIHDEKIDAVSNSNRPLISKELSKNDLEMTSKISFALALISAYASSHYVLFFTCLMIFIYFIYSNPPLRLKRFPILNSGLIGLACVSAVLTGFFLVYPDKSIVAFPFGLAVAIFIFQTAVSSYRDIKDFEGDHASGIKTLPVLIGLKKSKQIIAGVNCLLFLLVPWYFHTTFLVIPSIIASILFWHFTTEENYKGWKTSLVHTAYLIFIIGTIVFK